MKSARVGIYARVSTKDQTTENQLLDLRRYCESREWKVVGEFVDHGISGAKDDRPALKEIMTLARKRKVDVILVWRFDRFARSLPHLVNTLEELRILGVDFVSYQESIDTSTPQGRMMFGIMASLAEFERCLIRDRVMAGIRRAREEGKQLGRPKLTWDVSKALKMRAEGCSYQKIADTLSVNISTIHSFLKNLGKNPKAASL